MAVRDAVHGYSDQVLHQREWFFVLVTGRFEADPARLTEGEKQTMTGHAWQPIDGLDALPEPVWPAVVASLIDAAATPQRWPIQLGEVEESTVAVGG